MHENAVGIFGGNLIGINRKVKKNIKREYRKINKLSENMESIVNALIILFVDG